MGRENLWTEEPAGAAARPVYPLPQGRPLRLLIARLSHIGDCILTMPVLNALRDAYPDARIDWLVEKPSSPLLLGHLALDELIVVPRGWLKSPRLAWSVWRDLRRRRFDVSIDPQSLTKSAVPALLSGAKVRLGLTRPEGRELAPILNNLCVRPSHKHVVARSLDLLRPLGILAPRVRFDVPIPEAARAMADDYVRREGLGGGFVAVNPGAGWETRLWPTRRFGQVAAYLGHRHAMPSVVVWAGDRERVWANQIVGSSAGQARLAPPTSLMELAAVLERATFYLGSDTGPMHLAAAVGTRVLALHGPTLPEVSGPYGPGHRAILEVLDDSKRRKRRGADNWAMRRITAERVCGVCDEMLAPSADTRRDVA